MATIKDVARAANVNVSTVSRALSGSPKVSEKRRKLIVEFAEKLGYRPNHLAKGLKERSTHILGLVISSILNPALPGIVRGAEDAAMERGYFVVLCNADNDPGREKKYLDTLSSIWVDGVLMAPARDDAEHLRELETLQCPVVFMVRQAEDRFDAVCVDNLHSAHRAVSHLAATGCRRIAIVNGPQNVGLYRERFQGYRGALLECGLNYDPDLVWEFPPHLAEDFHQGVLTKLESGLRPDAIVAASGPTGASGPHILRAVRQFGLAVPDDVSILGFDDLTENAVTDPPLTVISQPFHEIGYRAANRLIDLVEDRAGWEGASKATTLLKTEFIYRGSTRPVHRPA